jgi:hypothetical protein
LNKEVERIEAEVKDKILSECGSKATEKDLQKILRKCRSQQQELVRQRNIDCVKQDEKIRQRLEEKRQAKVHECKLC